MIVTVVSREHHEAVEEHAARMPQSITGLCQGLSTSEALEVEIALALRIIAA